jgi:dihydroxyacetone kinase-like predicted kinase
LDAVAVEIAFMVGAAHAALKAQAARINALNVYPVPDGDTGTNMLLTLESILRETSDETYETSEDATRAVARAALMGARGNSGVILSQMVRGACEALAERASLTAEAFATALEGARERAYDSVREPVEGTMITVIKDAARAAREALPGRPMPRSAARRSCSRFCARQGWWTQEGWVSPSSSTAYTPALPVRR